MSLHLPWNYISREEVIAASGLQYGVQDWGLRNKYNMFIGKYMPRNVADYILALVEKDELDKRSSPPTQGV